MNSHASHGSRAWRWAGLVLLLASLGAVEIDIPELNWTKRSDWINVKTDVTPAATGDGVTDDTAAIQAALTLVSRIGGELDNTNARKVVYLPPGTYRISAQLTLVDTFGTAIIGHGRSTVLQWWGPVGGTMLRINAAVNAWYNGLVWDGRGVAAVGVHDGAWVYTYYETGNRHENESFKDFTDTGLLGKHDDAAQANADSMIRNCLFQRCGTGIRLANFNVFAYSIQGSEFIDCGVGISNIPGQSFIRDCHFARSRQADILAETGPITNVQRCTSVGSRRFFDDPGTFGKDGGGCSFRDCQIAGWTALDGAMRLYGGQTVVDCVFTSPPNRSPPLLFQDGRNTSNNLVVSGIVSPGTDGWVANQCANGTVTVVPRGIAGGPNLISATTHFLKTTESVGGTVFDARVQYGARADGVTDDTAAVQACIDAARQAGNQAVAYFPTGDYRITAPISVTGANYRIEGGGLRARFCWDSNTTGVDMFAVSDPQGILFRSLTFKVDNRLRAVLRHTATSATSSATYDFIQSYDYSGLYQVGVRFDGMVAGSRAHVIQCAGHIRIAGSSAAEILMDFSGDGNMPPLVVEGTAAKTGFLGVLSHEGRIIVRDNQDVVVDNQYCEGRDQFLTATGSPGATGRITQGGGAPLWTPWSKTEPGATDRRIVLIDNYGGRIHLGNTILYNSNPAGTVQIAQSGANPLDLSLLSWCIGLSDQSLGQDINYALGSSVRRTSLGNATAKDWVRTALPDVMATGGLAAIAAAWDDLARLGRYDLDWSYSHRFDQADAPAAPPMIADGVYRLRNVWNGSDGLYLMQQDFWAATVTMRPLDTAGDWSNYQLWHVERVFGDTYQMWFNHEDANGPKREYLAAAGNAEGSLVDAKAQNRLWRLIDAGGGRLRLQLAEPDGSGRNLRAQGNTAGAAVVVSGLVTGTGAGSEQWELQRVDRAPTMAPTTLTARALSTTSIRLDWMRTGTDDDRYLIERKTGAGGTWAVVGSIEAREFDRGFSWFIATGLASSTAYVFRVRGQNDTGSGPASNEAGASTPAGTTRAPEVRLTAPTAGATYAAPASIALTATAGDSDGSIATIAFFAGATKLGESTVSPYAVAWTAVPAGTYTVTARATDNLGLTATSNAVTVTVGGGNQPPVISTSTASPATVVLP